MGVALGQGGEIHRLAEETEGHLERGFGRVLGVNIVGTTCLGAEADAVVADDDVGKPGVNGQLGELDRGQYPGPGDRRSGREPAITDADGHADLVGRGAVHGLGFGGDPVDLRTGQSGVVEGAAHSVD